MNELPAKLRKRAARKSAKRDEKKRQIAESAIEALKELGYANTSLRDIAAKSDLSLGMLHYYFEDRSDLIIYCVSRYKEEFVRGVEEALRNAQGRDQVIAALANGLVSSIFDDEMVHRLWYDIRTQAMFDAAFRPIVSEIETSLQQLVKTAFVKAGGDPEGSCEIEYALVDGVFRYLMQGQIGDNPRSRTDMTAILSGMLEQIL